MPPLDYLAIFKKFNQLKLDYVVVDGLAVNLHAVPRMPYDIDLMVRLAPPNILGLVTQLTTWGYRPRPPVDPKDLAVPQKRNSWIEEKGMKAFTFHSSTLPIGEIDLVIDTPIPYAEIKQRAITIVLHKEKVPVVSLPDLINLKTHAGRQQDLSDVKYLRRIKSLS